MDYSEGNCKAVVLMVSMNFALSMVNVLFKQILDKGIDRMVISTYRLAIAALFSAPLAFFRERNNRAKLTVTVLCQIFFSAMIGASLLQYFFLLGLKYTSVTFSCAFANMVPAITFTWAVIFRQEKLNVRSNGGKAKVLGTLLSIAGALSLVLYKGRPLNPKTPTEGYAIEQNYQKTKRWAIGSLFLIIGTTFWSLWFIVQAKISKKYPLQYSSTAILSFFGAVQSALLSLTTERTTSMWILKGWFDRLAVLYAGMVGSGLCFVGMTWCVNHKGPVFTSAFTPFLQIFAAIISTSFFHEEIHLGSVVGSVVVIAGLYVLLWGKSKDSDQGTVSKVVEIQTGAGDVEDPDASSHAAVVNKSSAESGNKT